MAETVLTRAMVFPGQGSQAVGMQAELAAEFPVVQETYAEATEVLGYDLWSRVQSGPAENLAETTVTQPAMLTAGTAAYRVWKAAGGAEPGQVAGHSVGEYSALVAAGALSFADALKVVIQRSELMSTAVPPGVGGMAAIIGLDDESIFRVCMESSSIGIAEPVNFNSPGQTVIAGHINALERAIELLKEAGARRAVFLPVSVPNHSSLMTNAGKSLLTTLESVKFQLPGITVVASSDGMPYKPDENMPERLSQQVYGPVQWVKTVNTMIAGGATNIVECGPGKVLAGLCRRIDKGTPTSFIDSLDSLHKSLDA